MDVNQGNTGRGRPGTKRGHGRSKSATPSQGQSFGISRGPMGPHFRRPFSRGRVNHLPCTEAITGIEMATAEVILRDATPPGFALESVRPQVRLGRNPHRWIGVFHNDHNQYDTGCDAIVHVKKQFKRVCPQGADISSVILNTGLNNRCYEIEYIVNCFCTKIPRRRRSVLPHCNRFGYTTEPGNC